MGWGGEGYEKDFDLLFSRQSPDNGGCVCVIVFIPAKSIFKNFELCLGWLGNEKWKEG